MAVNPMQRRARISFLTGFLVALIVGALVIVLLLMQLKKMKGEIETLNAQKKSVLVTSDDVKSGTEVSLDTFMTDEVQTNIFQDELVTSSDFEYVDEETGEIYEKKLIMKTDVPAGTVVTKDLLEEVDEKTTSDKRLQEYNMIILPTYLETGDYIDVRIRLPGGEDYIVVSKKKVQDCTADTIWIQLSEDETLTLGNAIMEAYSIQNSKLYATIYTQPGLQDAATQTYPVNQAVLTLINNNPNIVNEAKEALWARYNDQEQVEQRNNHINAELSNNVETMKETLASRLEEEITNAKEARQTYVQSLEGGDSTIE